MSITAYHNSIRNRFSTVVAVPQSLSTCYDNMPGYVQPENGIWCRLTMKTAERNQISIGKQKTFRTHGQMIIQIFDDIENGTKDIDELIDIIDPLFRARTENGIVYRTPTINELGRDGGQSLRDAGQNLWQVNMICPFYYDETI